MTEDQLEQECLDWLADVGWQHRHGPDIAPEGSAPERDNYRQVLLLGRLRSAVAALNPAVPAAAREDAIRQGLDLGIGSRCQQTRVTAWMRARRTP